MYSAWIEGLSGQQNIFLDVFTTKSVLTCPKSLFYSSRWKEHSLTGKGKQFRPVLCAFNGSRSRTWDPNPWKNFFLSLTSKMNKLRVFSSFYPLLTNKRAYPEQNKSASNHFIWIFRQFMIVKSCILAVECTFVCSLDWNKLSEHRKMNFRSNLMSS